MDAPDCIASSRFLMVAQQHSRWKIFFRVASGIFYVVAGAFVTLALIKDPTRTGVEVAMFLVGALVIYAVTALLLETILRR